MNHIPSGLRVWFVRIWPRMAEQTINYGVMERADRVAVIPVDIG